MTPSVKESYTRTLRRKAKKKVANVLHIDENANKEVEEDIVINEPVEK